MRNSPLRHPLAILRTTIGLTQKEMGDLVGRAARTIQSVELGHLPLSQDLAMLLAQATGVDLGWLLDGNPSVPPRKGLTAQNTGTAEGVYTREDYERHRAYIESPRVSKEEHFAAIQNPPRVEENGQTYVVIPTPVLKGGMLAHKRMIMESLDQKMVEALQSLLQETVVAPGGDLIRWKMRRMLQTLAEENSLKLELPVTPDPLLLNIMVAGRGAKHPQGRRKKKKGTQKA